MNEIKLLAESNTKILKALKDFKNEGYKYSLVEIDFKSEGPSDGTITFKVRPGHILLDFKGMSGTLIELKDLKND